MRVILRLDPEITASVLGRSYAINKGMDGDPTRW